MSKLSAAGDEDGGRRKPAHAAPLSAAEIAALLARCADFKTIFLAVSGGGDSSALMRVAALWRDARETSAVPDIEVLTVDHGLRPEAAAEAQAVARDAAACGFKCHILTWRGDLPEHGIQAWAREVRYELLFGAVRAAAQPAALVLAHHQGDVAETVLMRLARGSGLDGLAVMSAETVRDGIVVLRSFVDTPKERLIATLRALGATWQEDPSNLDLQFERVRVRRARAAREELGLSDAALGLTARRMARARRALERETDRLLAPCLEEAALAKAGLVRWRWRAGELPEEIAVRLLRRIVTAVGGLSQPVRLLRVERTLAAMLADGFAGATLGHAIIAVHGRDAQERAFDIFREPARHAFVPVRLPHGGCVLWDQRFEVAWPGAGQDVLGDVLEVRAFRDEDRALFENEADRGCERLPAGVLNATPVIALDGRALYNSWFGPALGADPELAAAIRAADFSARFDIARFAAQGSV